MFLLLYLVGRSDPPLWTANLVWRSAPRRRRSAMCILTRDRELRQVWGIRGEFDGPTKSRVPISDLGSRRRKIMTSFPSRRQETRTKLDTKMTRRQTVSVLNGHMVEDSRACLLCPTSVCRNIRLWTMKTKGEFSNKSHHLGSFWEEQESDAETRTSTTFGVRLTCCSR